MDVASQVIDAEKLLKLLDKPRRAFFASIEIDASTWHRWKNGLDPRVSNWKRFEAAYHELQREARERGLMAGEAA